MTTAGQEVMERLGRLSTLTTTANFDDPAQARAAFIAQGGILQELLDVMPETPAFEATRQTYGQLQDSCRSILETLTLVERLPA